VEAAPPAEHAGSPSELAADDAPAVQPLGRQPGAAASADFAAAGGLQPAGLLLAAGAARWAGGPQELV
jgi:hypothetical protein